MKSKMYMTVSADRTNEFVVYKYGADAKRRFIVYVDGKRMNTYPLSYEAARRCFETYKKQCEKGERLRVELYELVEEVMWT